MKESLMKNVAILSVMLLSACMNSQSALDAHLEAEADFARNQYHVQQAIEAQYDPEYVDDCYYYESLVCEFE